MSHRRAILFANIGIACCAVGTLAAIVGGDFTEAPIRAAANLVMLVVSVAARFWIGWRGDES